MDMAKNQALFWIQIASTVAVLAGVLLVVIQLKQNEELLRFQIATELRSNRDALRNTVLGENYSQTLAKLADPSSTLTEAELHQFNAHAMSVFYELTHRHQLTEAGIFIGGWQTWLLEDRCLLFGNPTGAAWLDWMNEANGGGMVLDQIRNDLSTCSQSFPEFLRAGGKSRS